ncbi:glycosyltransferase family 2 protein [Ligilactobacillus sp. LYQ139]|uniref:glycosyltransferase family 2 protein n=1 Tax=Ligilactobacillus sp. LYQ139 TaxID=3378800 RepID=UPI0038519884
MKDLSIIVPCYNAENYMERCINSLLIGGSQVEIIIVDDGSSDRTGEIADYYAQKFSDIVRVIHQQNGGHGAAVTAGVYAATGTYVKVVDSDDWLDAKALDDVLTLLYRWRRNGIKADCLITNYIYDKVNARHKKVMGYQTLPQDRIFSWEDVRLSIGKYLIMHSLIYRRAVLVDQAHLELPHHKYYVDNLYVYEPLPYVQTLYYLDVNLYHYFIGRDDQSVNERVMLQRIDEQLFVNKRMIDYYSRVVGSIDRALGQYMERYLEIITTISSVLLLKENSPQSIRLRDDLWHTIYAADEQLYERLRSGVFGKVVNTNGRIGRQVAIGTYKIAQRLYGFN